ncbi:hypothetical protein AAG906_015483 [Vitis piasezkii]
MSPISRGGKGQIGGLGDKKWALMEEMSWRQNSREVRIRGATLTDDEGIKDGCVRSLEVSFLKEEVLKSVCGLLVTKLLGDDFTMAFDYPCRGVETLEDVASVMRCRVGKLPTSYLGLPLGATFKSPRVWDARQYLSKGGRLTLIKSTLSTLLIYLMSLLVIPRKVYARLEKIQRGFLWGGGALEKRPHLIILGKYGVEDGGWCSRGVREGYGVGVWEAIINEWEELRCRVHFMVGNGRRIKFWKDFWCEKLTLKEAFPNLFCLTVNQDGVLEQNSDHRPVEKEGLEYPEWVLLVQRRGGNYDHLLMFCGKARML